MKALVFHGPGKRAWEDKPKPALKTATDAILRITKTAVYGSDLSILNGEIQNVPDGLTLGHEGVGTIEEIGSDVSMFKVGDKAMISHTHSCEKDSSCKHGQYPACNEGACGLGRRIDGTLAEYARIPNADTSLQHIPEGADEGTLMMLKDILPTRFEYSIPNGQIQPGHTVVIFGSGHIGLTALLLAQFHSPAEIIMVDTNRYRLEASSFY
jgi:alcohol dehydrogenase